MPPKSTILYKLHTHPLTHVPQRINPHGMDCVISALESMKIFDFKTARALRRVTASGVPDSAIVGWLDDYEDDVVVQRIANDPSITPEIKRHTLVPFSNKEVEDVLSTFPDKHGLLVQVCKPNSISHVFVVIKWNNKLSVIDPQISEMLMNQSSSYEPLLNIKWLEHYVREGYVFRLVQQTVTVSTKRTRNKFRLRKDTDVPSAKRRRPNPI